jgi:hypothetical protein
MFFFYSLLFVVAAGCVVSGSHFTDPDPASVFVKRAGVDRYYRFRSNSTIRSVTFRGFSVLEVCSGNSPCHDALESSSTCNAITSTCNCLVWVGSINYAQSTGLTIRQLDTERKACVRVAVAGDGPLVINWSLRTVGNAIPNMLRNIAVPLWRNSNLGSIMSLSSFIRHVLAPRACNPLMTGPACLSQTVLHIEHLAVDYAAPISVVYGLVASFAWCVLIVFVGTFHLRETPAKKIKMG